LEGCRNQILLEKTAGQRVMNIFLSIS